MDSANMTMAKIPVFSPLHEAILKGDLNEVKRLVEAGANPMNPDLYNDTSLHHAATMGELEILKYFIDDIGCIPGVKGWKGTTPLHSAAQARQFDIIRYLIEECKLDPTDVDDYDQFPLHYAYRFGNVEFVRYLIKSMEDHYMTNDDVVSVRCDIERTYSPEKPSLTYGERCSHYAKASQHISPLQVAVQLGDLRRVRFLVSKLTQKQLDSYKNMDTLNCLRLAVKYGHEDLVYYFVKELKWDPTLCEVDDNSPIYSAIHYGQLKVVKLFMDKLGCDPSRKDQNNYTPLHVASMAGHLPIVKYLIEEKHCSPNVTDLNTLHNATHFGHYKLVRYLVEVVKMDQNIPNNDGLTTLSIAAKEGYLNIVSYLLKLLKNTVEYDRRSRTAMFCAVDYGHLDIVKHLMSVNPRMYSFVTKLTNSFTCPLPLATSQGHHDIVVYLLEESKSDPFVVYDDVSTTLLGIALSRGRTRLEEYFLEKLRRKNSSFIMNFLHTNAKIGELYAIKALISNFKLDPDSFHEGVTLMYQAAYHGHLNTVRYLIEMQQCSANSIDCQLSGTTPLHTAASRGHLNIVEYLIQNAGARPFVYDKEGNTAIHSAAKSGQVEILKFLSRYMPLELRNFRNETPLELAFKSNSSNATLFLVATLFHLHITS